MTSEIKQKAMRSIGFLEGFSAWAWSQVGPKLADEFMDQYDASVEALRKAITDETEERR